MKDDKGTKESKQVNFRIDPDSAEAFRLFCTSHGMNQAQGFDHLMQVLELNNAKTAVPGRVVEIENFERLTKELLSAYINSVELGSHAEECAKEQFRYDLKRKDRTIDELREKIEALETQKKDILTALSSSEEEGKRLKEQSQHLYAQMETAKKAASDQEEMNQLLKSQNMELQNKCAEYDSLKESEASLKKDNSALVLRVNDAELALSHESALRKNLEKQIAELTEQKKTQDHQILEFRVEQAELKKQLEEKSAETQNLLKQAAMQADLETERAVIAKERELLEELRRADRENIKLRTELEQLRAAATPANTPEEDIK